MARETPRSEAHRILTRFETGEGFLKSDMLVDDVLSNAGWHWLPQDKALLTTLVYGVLRQWILLEYIMGQLSHFPVHSIPPGSRALLKMGLFQMHCLNGIPDYAAIDTTVTLGRQQGLTSKTISFINGFLRTYQKKKEAGPYPVFPYTMDDNPVEYLHLTYAMPKWFVQRIWDTYGPEKSLNMAAIIKTPPPLTLRINTLKISVDDFKQALTDKEIHFRPTDGECPEVVLLQEFYGSPLQLPGYEDGWFAVQDLSSAMVSHWLDPHPGETIVDLCAGLGSKTTHIAALTENKVKIYAVDPDQRRLKTLAENMTRLGVDCVEAIRTKAEQWNPPEDLRADRVLVDAPCSGLGTVRKHPEILLQLSERQLSQFPVMQLSLLEKAAKLVRSGGILIYSACSVDPAEGANVVETFLKTGGFRLQREDQRRITEFSDGFYIAQLQKN